MNQVVSDRLQDLFTWWFTDFFLPLQTNFRHKPLRDTVILKEAGGLRMDH